MFLRKNTDPLFEKTNPDLIQLLSGLSRKIITPNINFRSDAFVGISRNVIGRLSEVGRCEKKIIMQK